MTLYPEITPFREYWLDVSDGHEMYVEEVGNPDGVPVVVLHGGPGGSCSPNMRRFFDPGHWRVILFDQRGAGRSRPSGALHANTTAHLLSDMERLREALGLSQWLVFGGSWGATLALLYAQQWPGHVLGLVLRGTFLFRRRDLDWLFRGGVARIYPDAWARFTQAVADVDEDDVLAAWYRQLCLEERADAASLASTWAAWEAACSTLAANYALRDGVQPDSLAMARIECHYSWFNGFIEENRILDNMAAIAHLPGHIVHGRYDMVCPLEQSWLVHQAWPGSELEIIDEAGHSALEPGIEAALVRAVATMQERFDA